MQEICLEVESISNSVGSAKSVGGPGSDDLRPTAALIATKKGVRPQITVFVPQGYRLDQEKAMKHTHQQSIGRAHDLSHKLS